MYDLRMLECSDRLECSSLEVSARYAAPSAVSDSQPTGVYIFEASFMKDIHVKLLIIELLEKPHRRAAVVPLLPMPGMRA
jgi:hypothetical protein